MGEPIIVLCKTFVILYNIHQATGKCVVRGLSVDPQPETRMVERGIDKEH